MEAIDLDLILKLIQIVGIPVAIYLFFTNKERERRDREYGTYDALDDKYIEYLRLCLDNPDLDVADIPQPQAAPLDAKQKHRELIMFSILISIMERAFLMYGDKATMIRTQQWEGWDAYARDWCQRDNFARALPLLRSQFDVQFVTYLDSLLPQAGKASR